MPSQTERIVQILADAGSLGTPSAAIMREMAPTALDGDWAGCLKYTARISNARQQGYRIEAFKIKGSAQWRYFLNGKQGEEPRFTQEYMKATTERLAARRIKKITWSKKPAILVDGSSLWLGEEVLA